MITQKDKMLRMILDDQNLRESYHYSENEYEDLRDALESDNTIIASVAKIIKELNGSTDPGEQKRVYKALFNYLNTHPL